MNKKKRSLLWKIDAPGHPDSSYVFGTMHVKDQRAFANQELVYRKIEACAAFATEFSLEQANQELGANAMDLPEGQTLDQLIPPKTYRKIQKQLLKNSGLDIKMFNTSKPLLISNLLAEYILRKDMPFSLDENLWRYAKSLEKITLGVETIEEQLAIMEKIPMEYQIKSLISIGKGYKNFRKSTLKMAKVYQTMDIQKIFKSAKKSSKGLRKVLLYDRNVVMAKRIKQMAQEQSICCAIGAAHLGGKKGVLRLLKQAGCKVKPVFE